MAEPVDDLVHENGRDAPTSDDAPPSAESPE